MIRVLVVDDDKLVRKGLISAMPWQKFNMEVVGEANNGHNALEFLECNAVDLILLDLSMPIMSGLELMEIIRQRYPNLFVVVLTMHKDFEYIQEALRLGAIDYIAKVQLEKECFDVVLSRIYDRIIERMRKDNEIIMKEDSFRFYKQDTGYALLSLKEHHGEMLFSRNKPFLLRSFIEIDNCIWLYYPSDEDNINGIDLGEELSKLIEDQDGWTVLKIVDLRNRDISMVKRLLRTYYKNNFFYEYDNQQNTITRSIKELSKKVLVISDEEQAIIENQWLSFNWVNDIDIFKELCSQIKNIYYPVDKLIRLLTLAEGEWNRLYSAIVSQRVELPQKVDNWQVVESWLTRIYDLTNRTMSKSKYSSEITNSIINAIKIIHDEMNEQLYAIDVARRVNMSRGYFNQCFKDITGRSFNNYLRFVRFQKAKEYLCLTDEPIYSIAQWIGYNDEKYFSRAFRQEIGLLPSEYRQKKRG